MTRVARIAATAALFCCAWFASGYQHAPLSSRERAAAKCKRVCFSALPAHTVTPADDLTRDAHFKHFEAPKLEAPVAFVKDPICNSTDERNALQTFFAITNGNQWSSADNWNTTAPLDQWEGIQCVDGFVAAITLFNHRLSGSCSTALKALETLTELQLLVLRQNQLYGELPSVFVVNFPSLRALDLDYNKLTGPLPRLQSTSLQQLLLAGNLLTGSIAPVDGIPNIVRLDLGENQFTGTLPSFSSSTALEGLRVANNTMTGTIHSFDRCPLLSVLALDDNQFEGTIPTFDKCPGLNYVYLGFNRLSGTLHSFNRQPGLVLLHVADNQLVGQVPHFKHPQLQVLVLTVNFFSGPAPTFDQLPSLRHFYIDANGFSGLLPTLNQSRQLLRLAATGNYFSGTIPSFDHIETLQYLGLSSNALEGTVPALTLPNLQYLMASDNRLSGPLPNLTLSSLSHLGIENNFLSGSIPNLAMPSLTSLWLANNLFSGSIPPFDSLPSLEVLSLAHNNLTGSISSLRSGTLRALYLDNNGLHGTLPDFGSTPALQQLGVSFNHLHGSVHLAADLVFVDVSANNFTGGLAWISRLPNLMAVTLSRNPWSSGLPASLPSSLETFEAIGCRLVGTIPTSWSTFAANGKLRFVVLRENTIRLPIPDLSGLAHLDLAHNSLIGTFRDAVSNMWRRTHSFADLRKTRLRVLDLSGNQIAGSLLDLFVRHPVSSSLFQDLQSLLLGDNAISGQIPSTSTVFDDTGQSYESKTSAALFLTAFHKSLRFFEYAIDICTLLTHPMQDLRLSGTNISAPFPAWLGISSLTDGFGSGYTLTCPSFISTSGCHVIISPSSHNSTLCRCNPSFFGQDGRHCLPCDDECFCHGRIVAYCFPATADALSLIPCLSASACNPNMLPWAFGIVSDYSVTPGWCAVGYEGRLCSRCRSGYYSQGVMCQPCSTLPVWLGWMSMVLFIIALVLIVIYFSSEIDSAGGQVQSGLVTILLFHCQQLALLVRNTFGVSDSNSSAISFSSSVTSFSLQSLLAIECWIPGYALPHRTYFALLTPILLFLLSLAVAIFARRHRVKVVGVTLCLLNVIYLPCVEVMLLALGCTDQRQPQTFLNLAPHQACDRTWASTILLPAICGVALFVFIFPITALMALKKHTSASASAFSQWYSSALPPLVGIFAHNKSWWFGIILMRRIILAAVVAFVPYFSVFLLLAVFGVLQLSALLQQFLRPFAEDLSNRAEISSLYVLLGSYFSMAILGLAKQTSTFVNVLVLITNVLFVFGVLFLIVRRGVLTCRHRRPKLNINTPRSRGIDVDRLAAPLLDDG